MSDVVKFVVPLVPPSVNSYVRHTRKGIHYVKANAEAFKNAVALFGRDKRVSAESYAVQIDVYLGRGQRGDIDNFAKLVLDGMAAAGVIHSDAAVTRLTLTKSRDKANPRTEIEVRAVGAE